MAPTILTTTKQTVRARVERVASEEKTRQSDGRTTQLYTLTAMLPGGETLEPTTFIERIAREAKRLEGRKALISFSVLEKDNGHTDYRLERVQPAPAQPAGQAAQPDPLAPAPAQPSEPSQKAGPAALTSASVSVIPAGARGAALNAALRWAEVVQTAGLEPVRTPSELLELAGTFLAFVQGAPATPLEGTQPEDERAMQAEPRGGTGAPAAGVEVHGVGSAPAGAAAPVAAPAVTAVEEEDQATLDDEGELPDDLLDVFGAPESGEAILAAERERAAREAAMKASGELASDDVLAW